MLKCICTYSVINKEMFCFQLGNNDDFYMGCSSILVT